MHLRLLKEEEGVRGRARERREEWENACNAVADILEVAECTCNVD